LRKCVKYRAVFRLLIKKMNILNSKFANVLRFKFKIFS